MRYRWVPLYLNSSLMVFSHLRVFFSQEQETAFFFLTSANTLANSHTSAMTLSVGVLCGKTPDQPSLDFLAGCENITASVCRP